MRDDTSLIRPRSPDRDNHHVTASKFSTSDAGAAGPTQVAIEFGPFRLLPTQHLLLEGDKPLRLGSRAMQILVALVERPGELLEKTELMARAWPNTVVDEGNLKVQVGLLRRALRDGSGGSRYLVTIPGRGYCFVAPVAFTEERIAWSPQHRMTPPESQPLKPRDQAIKEEQPVVFVIDDDAAVRAAIESLLRSVGLSVRAFRSTQDFMRIDLPDAPACLVLDVRLPGSSGLEFQRELAKLNIHLPTIFLTGHADIAMSVEAMKSGAIEFLTKPFRDQQLLDAVQLGIELGRTHRENSQNSSTRSAASTR